MSETLSLKIDCRPDELDRIASEANDLGEREGWPEAMTYRVHLVLEELGLNIMNYGYEDGDRDDHQIEITLTSVPNSLTIDIVDDGRPFDPLSEAPIPDTGATMEDRPIGGLGVHLVKTLMDEMNYRREKGKNRLTLVTRRSE